MQAACSVTYTCVVQSKRLDKISREEAIGDGGKLGLGPDTDDRYDDRYDDADGRRELLRGLRVGERVGKMRKYHAVGIGTGDVGRRRAGHRDDANRRAGPFDPETRRPRRPLRRPLRRRRRRGARRAWVVGLDAEWRPHKHSPVALLQVATRFTETKRRR